MDLDAVVRDLAPKVLGYCLLETRDRTLAEEIVQDALAALVQRWRRHGPPDSPAAFVFAIARRRSARALARRRLWLPIERLLDRRDRRLNPEEQAVGHAERDRVTAALAQLRRPDRQILLLVTVGGIGVDETARLLGVSVSAVKMRALRARNRLRQLLEDANGAGTRRA